MSDYRDEYRREWDAEMRESTLPSHMTPTDRKAIRDALVLAEDVLSRSPFSTAIWPNGVHPQIGITKIRDAIRIIQQLKEPT